MAYLVDHVFLASSGLWQLLPSFLASYDLDDLEECWPGSL